MTRRVRALVTSRNERPHRVYSSTTIQLIQSSGRPHKPGMARRTCGISGERYDDEEVVSRPRLISGWKVPLLRVNAHSCREHEYTCAREKITTRRVQRRGRNLIVFHASYFRWTETRGRLDFDRLPSDERSLVSSCPSKQND